MTENGLLLALKVIKIQEKEKTVEQITNTQLSTNTLIFLTCILVGIYGLVYFSIFSSSDVLNTPNTSETSSLASSQELLELSEFIDNLESVPEPQYFAAIRDTIRQVSNSEALDLDSFQATNVNLNVSEQVNSILSFHLIESRDIILSEENDCLINSPIFSIWGFSSDSELLSTFNMSSKSEFLERYSYLLQNPELIEEMNIRIETFGEIITHEMTEVAKNYLLEIFLTIFT